MPASAPRRILSGTLYQLQKLTSSLLVLERIDVRSTIETPRGTISYSTVTGMAGAHVAASTLNFVSGTSFGAMCCIRLWKCQHSCCETGECVSPVPAYGPSVNVAKRLGLKMAQEQAGHSDIHTTANI